VGGIDVNWRKPLVGLSLALMIAAALVIAAGAAGLSSSTLHIHNHGYLPPELRGPFQHLDLTITDVEFVLLIGVLGIGYLVVLALASSVSARVGIGAIIALHLIFALAPPLLSSDIFNYVGYARLWGVHDFNPYGHPLASAPTDVSYPFVGLKLHNSPYGPLFTLISTPIGLLGLAPAVWTLKALVASASLGCVALVAASARLRGLDPLKAALLVGLNPVLLVWAVGGGHNDLIVMLFALTGIYFLLQDRIAGLAGLIAATSTKLSAGLLLPFAVLGARDRRRAAIWVVVGGALAAGIALLIFRSDLLTGLLDEFQTQSDLDSPNDIPGAIDDLFGLGLATRTLSRIGGVVFVGVLAWQLVRVFRGADWLEGAGWATIAALATTTWFLPWYFVWFLPLAALAPRRDLRIAAIAVTALVIGLQVPELLSPPGREN
jgi:hypothetical protein